MVIEPKTWTDHEILALIEKEIRETKKNCDERKVPWVGETAEMILSVLESNHLIERTP